MEEGDIPTATALVGQVMEGCPLPELMALITQNDEASAHLIGAANLVAGVTANQGALLAVGLPATLIALIASEAPPSQRPALTHPVSGQALALLHTLLRGQHASATAGVVIAAGGVGALVAALHAGEPVGNNAACCLLAVTEGAPNLHSAIAAAGAVPALFEAVRRGEEEEEESGKAAAAARTLLLLTTTQAAVMKEVKASCFNVAALTKIAGLPFDPP